jgi:hypothetical protein
MKARKLSAFISMLLPRCLITPMPYFLASSKTALLKDQPLFFFTFLGGCGIPFHSNSSGTQPFAQSSSYSLSYTYSYSSSSAFVLLMAGFFALAEGGAMVFFRLRKCLPIT